MVALFSAACSKYDDSELQNLYTSLESRVKLLENTINSINSSVTAMQQLVSKGCVITEVKEVKDAYGNITAYEITTSDGKTLTVHNGQDGVDGTTPVVSAARDGGVLYWTVNGSWLLVDGAKVPCTGAAPQVKVENDRWWISTDGINWTDIGSAVTYAGEGGGGLFSRVEVGEEYVTFTLISSGDSFNVPLYQPFAIVFESLDVAIQAGGTVKLPYTITGKTDATTVGVINAGIFNVSFEEGSLCIEAPASFEKGVVTVYADNGAGATSIRTLNVSLYVAPLPASVIFRDTFDWCTGTANEFGKQGNAIEVVWNNLTDTNGWSCEKVNGGLNCWARAGHLRFSRTGYAGMLVSPKLEAIEGTKTIEVKFQMARWCSTDGLHDDNWSCCIQVWGAGTPSVNSLEITCDYNVIDWQSKEDATYRFIIEGATAETQVVWIAAPSPDGIIPARDGNGDGNAQATNRLVMDNVEVNVVL